MPFNKKEILTVPNGLTAARLLSIPSLYKRMRDNPRGTWPIAGLFAFSDKFDGVAARLEDTPTDSWLGRRGYDGAWFRDHGFRRSELGRKGDPVIDVAFTSAMAVAGMEAKVIPKWLGGLSLVQKAAKSAVTLNAEHQGIELEVSKVGKAAEFITNIGFGVMFAGESVNNPETRRVVRSVGTGMTVAGIGLASIATLGYVNDTMHAVELQERSTATAGTTSWPHPLRGVNRA